MKITTKVNNNITYNTTVLTYIHIRTIHTHIRIYSL